MTKISEILTLKSKILGAGRVRPFFFGETKIKAKFYCWGSSLIMQKWSTLYLLQCSVRVNCYRSVVNVSDIVKMYWSYYYLVLILRKSRKHKLKLNVKHAKTYIYDWYWYSLLDVIEVPDSQLFSSALGKQRNMGLKLLLVEYMLYCLWLEKKHPLSIFTILTPTPS